MIQSNKGTIMEVFLIVVVLFIIAIGLPIVKTIYTDINESMTEEMPDKGAELISEAGAIFPVLDGMFLFIVIGLGVAGVILAFTVEFHPAFYIFTIIIAAIGVIVTVIFSDAYVEMADSSALVGAKASFPIMNFVMSNLVIFIVAISFLIIIVMFAKLRGGGGD